MLISRSGRPTPRIKASGIFHRINRQRGAILPFVIALLGVVVLGLAFFFLSFDRLLGSSNEQKTSVESASLTIAGDLSKIVIDDPNYGFVGLSDQAPTGT